MLFRDERAVPAALNDAKVGGVVALPSREKEGEWEGLEEIELWHEEDEGQRICGDESGPVPP